jgi:hypothetical protein
LETVGPEARRRDAVLAKRRSAKERERLRLEGFTRETWMDLVRHHLPEFDVPGAVFEALPWHPLSLPVVLDQVAIAMDRAAAYSRLGCSNIPEFSDGGRLSGQADEYQVWVEIDDPEVAMLYGWSQWGFAARMQFLCALRVSGELATYWKNRPEIRVRLLEPGDGNELLRGRGPAAVYSSREVVVWRCGELAPEDEWRPRPGRKAARVRR